MLANQAAPTDCTGTRLIGCLVIAIGAGAFLWLYSTVNYRDPPTFPGKSQTTSSVDRQEINYAPTLVTEKSSVAVAEVPPGATKHAPAHTARHQKQTTIAREQRLRRVHKPKVPLRPEFGTAYAQAPFQEPFNQF
jgi:hypothetical protein